MGTPIDSVKNQTYLEYQIPTSYKVEWHSDCIPKSPGSLSRASSVKSIPSLISAEICDCSTCGDFCKSGCPNRHSKGGSNRPLTSSFSQVDSDSDYTSNNSYNMHSRHRNKSSDKYRSNQSGEPQRNATVKMEVSNPGYLKQNAPKSQLESGNNKINALRSEPTTTFPEYVITVQNGKNEPSQLHNQNLPGNKQGKVVKLIAGFDKNPSNPNNGSLGKNHHGNDLEVNGDNVVKMPDDIQVGEAQRKSAIGDNLENVNPENIVCFYESQSDMPESHNDSFCSDISESIPSSSEDFANTMDLHASTPVHMSPVTLEKHGYPQKPGYYDEIHGHSREKPGYSRHGINNNIKPVSYRDNDGTVEKYGYKEKYEHNREKLEQNDRKHGYNDDKHRYNISDCVENPDQIDLKNNNKNDGYYGNNDLDIDEDAFMPIPYAQSDEDIHGYHSNTTGYHSN
ncbi:unnamed protein product, partial [Owenia fusiformis]